MAHQQQIEFCRFLKDLHPSYFSRRIVLDIGALDINGNNQYLFENCLYLGVDLLPGRNVDFASTGHEFNLPNESLDVVVSTECFEHDRFYGLTLINIVRMLKPGGLFFFSCATAGRPEHGTRRTTPFDAPFTQMFDDWGDYYKNLEESDIRAVLDIEGIFQLFHFSMNNESHDLYFWGIKKGEFIVREDYSFILQENEHENQISTLKQNLVEHENQISALKQNLVEHENQISALKQNLIMCEKHAKEIKQNLFERDQTIMRMEMSRSWRITKPLRMLTYLRRSCVHSRKNDKLQ